MGSPVKAERDFYITGTRFSAEEVAKMERYTRKKGGRHHPEANSSPLPAKKYLPTAKSAPWVLSARPFLPLRAFETFS
jgi:hypothetical protein